ncbi:MAG: 16S rRNA (cytidine(1402)-2'-O)-methyltransferase [Tissierella sp.]|nr:16S rRNA (cytidine(1402)-2'-O)-methyltransferase [Tissierella sp.]
MEIGKLYICPTPIGNLEDITLRTLRTLKEVDLIAAEDTRHTIKLLNHYEIKKPLTSYHEHNIKEKGIELIERLNKGENIALVSDAGMPGISDPGQDLIRLAIEEGIQVIVLPGPTASIAALVVSGLNTDKFVFEGFLSSRKKERVDQLKLLKDEKRTLIIYESPHRILDTLDNMLNTLENRNIAIVRELTKIYEEIFRGTIQEAIGKFSTGKIKGEFVIIIEGNQNEDVELDIDIEGELLKYINRGLSKKESVKKVAEEFNLPKNEVYQKSIELN